MNKLLIVVLILIVATGLVYYFMFYSKKSASQGEGAATCGITIDSCPAQNLKIDVLKEGTGSPIEPGNTAVVHYTGNLEDGVKFDSSLDRGEPFSFLLGAGQVIKGWDMGVTGMKVGEKRKLTIASNLAYGDQGIPGVIPPKSTLIFEVELLEIR